MKIVLAKQEFFR